MSNYMLLRDTLLKVPLKAPDDKDGFCKVKKGRKILISLYPQIERLWVYYLYGQNNRGAVASWLVYWNKNITPMEIDDIINHFEDQHPEEDISLYELSDTPTYASEEHGVEIPTPGKNCILSLEHEKELIGLIAEHRGNAFGHLQHWFVYYIHYYGYNYRKEYGDNATSELAINFLNQHGLSPQILEEDEQKVEFLRKVKLALSSSKTLKTMLTNFLVMLISFVFFGFIGTSFGDSGWDYSPNEQSAIRLSISIACILIVWWTWVCRGRSIWDRDSGLGTLGMLLMSGLVVFILMIPVYVMALTTHAVVK